MDNEDGRGGTFKLEGCYIRPAMVLEARHHTEVPLTGEGPRMHIADLCILAQLRPGGALRERSPDWPTAAKRMLCGDVLNACHKVERDGDMLRKIAPVTLSTREALRDESMIGGVPGL